MNAVEPRRAVEFLSRWLFFLGQRWKVAGLELLLVGRNRVNNLGSRYAGEQQWEM